MMSNDDDDDQDMCFVILLSLGAPLLWNDHREIRDEGCVRAKVNHPRCIFDCDEDHTSIATITSSDIGFMNLPLCQAYRNRSYSSVQLSGSLPQIVDEPNHLMTYRKIPSIHSESTIHLRAASQRHRFGFSGLILSWPIAILGHRRQAEEFISTSYELALLNMT